MPNRSRQLSKSKRFIPDLSERSSKLVEVVYITPVQELYHRGWKAPSRVKTRGPSWVGDSGSRCSLFIYLFLTQLRSGSMCCVVGVSYSKPSIMSGAWTKLSGQVGVTSRHRPAPGRPRPGNKVRFTMSPVFSFWRPSRIALDPIRQDVLLAPPLLPNESFPLSR